MGRAAIMLTSHGSRASVKGCDAARMELCLPALVECDAEGDCQGGRSARIAEGADDVGETVETRHRVSAGEEAPDGEVTLRLGGTPQV